MAADKKMIGLNIKSTICEDIVLVRGNNMLNNSGGFAHSPLPDNNGKAVFKRICPQEISDIFPVVYPDEILAEAK
jgi:hypothetical protein